ncbi:MAG: hypothetical protein IPH85_04145 [Ignavibacteria bacterium]|nr:hypothetical protein [Ignavibacteria bacterium]MBK7185109.1 hypothetical protein [Ignavibacteria bacterium]
MMINKKTLRPYEYADLIRLGNRNGDGGYVVPGKLVDTADVLLSLGLAEEWTFDMEMQERNPALRIIGVDHSIQPRTFMFGLVRCTIKNWIYTILRNDQKRRKYTRLREHYGDYFRLFTQPSVHVRKMVASDDRVGCISFNTLMRMATPSRDHSVFLKMDIESSEYEIISQIVAHERSISVITAEFHDLVSDSETFNNAIEELQQRFDIVHIHSNNYGGYCQINDFPDTVEITFVNKALMGSDPKKTTCAYPRPELDITNCSEKVDYELHF